MVNILKLIIIDEFENISDIHNIYWPCETSTVNTDISHNDKITLLWHQLSAIPIFHSNNWCNLFLAVFSKLDADCSVSPGNLCSWLPYIWQNIPFLLDTSSFFFLSHLFRIISTWRDWGFLKGSQRERGDFNLLHNICLLFGN